MKKGFSVLIIALGLLALTGCGGPDYTRRVTICQSPLNGQFGVDEIGGFWELDQEYPPGTELELGIRECGNLYSDEDDRIISVTVLYMPDVWAYERFAEVTYVLDSAKSVEATDEDGNIWAFLADGYSVGDQVLLIMDSMETETIYDDQVIDVIR